MKLYDVVKIKRDVQQGEIFSISEQDPDNERSGTVLVGDEGTIIEEYQQHHAFTVEFGVERDESLLVDCKAEDLELVIEFEEGVTPSAR